jgi:hypothetical protein
MIERELIDYRETDFAEAVSRVNSVPEAIGGDCPACPGKSAAGRHPGLDPAQHGAGSSRGWPTESTVGSRP